MHRVVLPFLALVAAVVGLSFLSGSLWGGKPEGPIEAGSLVINEQMTVEQFGRQNNLPPMLLKRVFGLQAPADRQKPVAAFGMSTEQVVREAEGLLALRAEHGSKNWVKIFAKFGLWFAFLSVMFFLMIKRRVSAKNRVWLLLAAVAIFGVALGADPNPMGTVKDAVVLLGTRGVLFPPRLIAFGVFLLLVILANKFICTWGCQFGTLQDAIYRLNRDKLDRKGRFGQFKVPFVVTNTIRVLFFATVVVFAFAWSTDIVAGVDPFKIFSPQVLGWTGIAFIGIMVVLSLFMWRPWCHFFCPFGLAGWVAEKISLYKIHVNYDKCIACGACEKACPSTVMGAILKRDRVIPDCFACGTCVETCPVEAIGFQAGRRSRPPAGKFANDSVPLGKATLKQKGEEAQREKT